MDNLFLYPWTHNSYLAIDGHRSVEDAVHAQDGRLWGVDDGCTKHGAKHAAVADGKGASVHIFNSKLIFTSLRAHSRDFLIFVMEVNQFHLIQKSRTDCSSLFWKQHNYITQSFLPFLPVH